MLHCARFHRQNSHPEEAGTNATAITRDDVKKTKQQQHKKKRLRREKNRNAWRAVIKWVMKEIKRKETLKKKRVKRPD